MQKNSKMYVTMSCISPEEEPRRFCCCCFSVAQSCPTLCNPMNCSTPGFPVLHLSWSLLKLMFIELVMPSNHLILCCPFLLLPSIFSSIRVFSSESGLHIGWPKYWSFRFSVRPSNEYSGCAYINSVQFSRPVVSDSL